MTHWVVQNLGLFFHEKLGCWWICLFSCGHHVQVSPQLLLGVKQVLKLRTLLDTWLRISSRWDGTKKLVCKFLSTRFLLGGHWSNNRSKVLIQRDQGGWAVHTVLCSILWIQIGKLVTMEKLFYFRGWDFEIWGTVVFWSRVLWIEGYWAHSKL
jgi:hypothetical protein